MIVAGNTPKRKAGVTNMILELGNVSVDTKGPPFSENVETYQGTPRLWADL